MNQFMRAHGHLPGPTQRPVVAGALSGAVAFAASLPFGPYSGVVAAISRESEAHPALAGCAIAVAAVVGGALYGRVFMRAANDRRGAWLFGIGFGFLLWMLGPGAVVPWLWHSPLATGRAGQALFVTHLAYGLVLGLAFPRVHRAVRRRRPWASTREVRFT